MKKITDCAFYGKFSMLKHILQSGIYIDELAVSNALVFALREHHYDIAEYLLERNVNNILAYDYILQNKEYSNHCEYLFKTFGDK